MYIRLMYSKELLKGTLQTIILKLLAENGRMYGYEITQRVKELSGDQINLTEGALYPTLHKLEAEGLLQTETVNIGKRVRKYYNLTSKGSITAQNKVDEFARFVSAMKFILTPTPLKQV
jgi:DNA-binding PadR family transcriptional regulator